MNVLDSPSSTTSNKNGNKEARSSLDWKSISFVLLLALLSGYILFGRSSSYNRKQSLIANEERIAWKEELEKSYPFIVGEVPRIEWNYSEPNFADKIVALGKPVVLLNSPTKNWPALKEWRPSYLIQHLPILKKTQAHENRTFSYFKEAKPMSKLPEIRKKFKGKAFTNADVRSDTFFKFASQYPPKGLYYYSVIALDDLGPIKNDLWPLEPFVSLPESVRKSVKLSPQTSNQHRWTTLWFGPSGATTHAHYDVHNNFYAQIYGRKRFILFPPEQHRNLYLNGFLHTAAQQAQVDLDHPDYKKFPLFKDAAGLDTILNPGDVLYLPALWFHHVIALDLSFSVSIWSKAEETIHMWEAEKVAPPIRASWHPLKLAYAGQVYLERLVSQSMSDVEDPQLSFLKDFDSFLADIWDQRFKYLVEEIPSLSRQNLDDSRKYCNLKKSMGTSISGPELKAIMDSADHVASLMRKVKSPLTRAIWLGNFCEHMALGVTQLENMVAYLQSLVEC